MARRFKFRLETVLKLRQRLEDEKKRVVADRLREIVQATNDRHGIQQQIEHQIDAMRGRIQQGKIDTRYIARDRHWLSRLNLQVLETQAAIRTLQAKLSMEQAELSEASKQRKILDKLRERQMFSYRQTVEKLEQKESDELAVLRCGNAVEPYIGQPETVRE